MKNTFLAERKNIAPQQRAQAMPEGRETALGRVRGFAPHRGYAAINKIRPTAACSRTHSRYPYARHLIRADWKPPATFDTHFTDEPCKINHASYQKIIFAGRPKGATQKG